MSTSANAALATKLASGLPVEERVPAHVKTVEVYNLLVLVKQGKDGGTSARAANLLMDEVRADTVRGALASLVRSARRMISESLASDSQVGWIDPPLAAEECESSFMVPLHL